MAGSSSHPRLRKTFSTLLAGVVSALPVMVTVWLLVVLYRLLRGVGDTIIDGLFRFLNFLRGVKPADPEAWAFEFPGANLIQALLPVLIVFGVGFAVTNRPGRRALAWVERRIDALPILGFVYSSIKQLVDALKGLGGEKKFKGVAYIEYPSPGCRLLGFVTANYFDEQRGKDVTAVFMPTSPNPLTGFVLIIDDEKVTNCDMTLEEASKLIISAGLVSPMTRGDIERVTEAKSPSE
ncbi:DUF502 domain-containing protein [Haloferula sp.]|uniref:DUF502 domain-containing protein n=1 Tax=Haloferula sp. TaxID=2497595 RepID=UPI0032A06650